MKTLRAFRSLVSIVALAGVLVMSAAANAASGGGSDISVLIETSDRDYAELAQAIEGAGGTVTNTYQFVNGMSAILPAASLASIHAMDNIVSIRADETLTPGPAGGYEVRSLGASLDSRADLDSATAANIAYSFDADYETMSLTGAEIDQYFGYHPDSMNTLAVNLADNAGETSLVVIIDTGVYADHFLFGGRVVGGVDLSTDVGTPLEGATEVWNHWHGTHVGGTVAGNGAILLPENDLLALSFEMHSGETLPEFLPGLKIMPLLGAAPAASLYAVKVFPASGAGAPTSTIIAGIEHAIDMKVNQGIDVDVINMSLGGGTGFEGRDLESQVVDAATAAGIAVVVSAGNDGPASQTIGSPSGANSAITVGAATHPVNQRVFWDFNFGILGVGDLLYVDDNSQMVYFSSRANTGDGRQKPDVSAVGAFVLSAFTGSPGALGFSSGTSMSSPGIAGIVALLNTHSENNGLGASPYDFKQAVMAGATPMAGFDEYEQGAGFIDAADALAALQADSSLGEAHPSISNGHTRKSAKPHGKSLQGVNGQNGATFRLEDLKPGYVEDFYFSVHPNAERIVIEVSDVELGVDPILFNSFEFHLSSAMRTTDSTYYIATTNVWGDAVMTVENNSTTVAGAVFGVNTQDMPIMPGHMRLSIENDWTSFDNMSGTVTVRVEHGNNSDRPDETYGGVLGNHESDGFFPVGFGPNGVELTLDWKNNWSRYPSSDMDMIVAWFDTGGGLHFEFGGATFASPEILSIDSSDISAVFVLIDGFETYDQQEPWSLEVRHK